jgi:Holliday junction resolvase
MTEAKLQTKIIKDLESKGYYVVKTIKLNKNGLHDVFAFKNGLATFIEVKATGKKPPPLQLFRIEEVKNFGIKSFWTDNFNDYLTQLKTNQL